jgi:hypothetical protein
VNSASLAQMVSLISLDCNGSGCLSFEWKTDFTAADGADKDFKIARHLFFSKKGTQLFLCVAINVGKVQPEKKLRCAFFSSPLFCLWTLRAGSADHGVLFHIYSPFCPLLPAAAAAATNVKLSSDYNV